MPWWLWVVAYLLVAGIAYELLLEWWQRRHSVIIDEDIVPLILAAVVWPILLILIIASVTFLPGRLIVKLGKRGCQLLGRFRLNKTTAVR